MSFISTEPLLRQVRDGVTDGTEWVMEVDKSSVFGLWTIEEGPKPEAKLRLSRHSKGILNPREGHS